MNENTTLREIQEKCKVRKALCEANEDSAIPCVYKFICGDTPQDWEFKEPKADTVNLNNLAFEAYSVALNRRKIKGDERFKELLMDIVEEIGEAGNEWYPSYTDKDGKPCGTLYELADVVIATLTAMYVTSDDKYDIQSIILEKMGYNKRRTD